MTGTDLVLLPPYSFLGYSDPASFHNHGFSPVRGWKGPLLPIYTFNCSWLWLHGMLWHCNMRTYRPCRADQKAFFYPDDPWWYMYASSRYYR
jgi:hypothetical protein